MKGQYKTITGIVLKVDQHEQSITMPIIADIAPLQKERESIKADMTKLAHQIESLIHGNATKLQNQEQYSQEFSLLEDKLKKRKAAAEKLDQQISDALVRRKNIEIFLEGLKTVRECITEFDISTWHRLVDNMKVMPDKTLLLQMRNVQIPVRQGHLHGVLRPPTRSFKATVTVDKATFYNGYGTPKGVTNIQEVVKWLTTERF